MDMTGNETVASWTHIFSIEKTDAVIVWNQIAMWLGVLLLLFLFILKIVKLYKKWKNGKLSTSDAIVRLNSVLEDMTKLIFDKQQPLSVNVLNKQHDHDNSLAS